jgi:hypothetical protein
MTIVIVGFRIAVVTATETINKKSMNCCFDVRAELEFVSRSLSRYLQLMVFLFFSNFKFYS